MPKKSKKRGPKNFPKHWILQQSSLDAYDKTVDVFENALEQVWAAKTKARNSAIPDIPDCEEAGRFIMTNLPPARWVRNVRILAYFGHVAAGIAITMAFTTVQTTQTFTLLIVMGVLVALVVGIFQETLLR